MLLSISNLRHYVREVKLAAEFSPLSVGFACSIDMVLFSAEIFFELSFSLDFSYIVNEFLEWVKSWIAGESDGDDDEASAAASSALGAPAALGFLAHPSFAFDAVRTQHGRVYDDLYGVAKRSVAPRARSLALVRAHATLGRDDADHMQGGDLREHIGHEHERHASLVALVAAARAHSSESALGAAMRAAPVEVSSHIAAILGAAPTHHGEWVSACTPKSTSSDATLHDVCDASAAAAAVACASTPGSTDCAYALSALRSRHCASRSDIHPHIESCSSAERLRAAFPACSRGCVAAMHGVGSACGFLVPRAGHGHSGEDSSACDGAVRAAQSQCAPSSTTSSSSLSSSPAVSSSHDNAACVDALSAVPGALIAKASEHSAAFMGGKHVLTWSEAGARGVLHDGMCALASDGHLDLRGNELVGGVPACMLAAGSESSGNLFIARNRLSGRGLH
jgi:hypothetical protein